MQVKQLKDFGYDDWDKVTASVIAEKLMFILKKHVGKSNAVTKEALFEKVYKAPASQIRALNAYVLHDILTKALSYLRSRTNCFVISERQGQDYICYVITNTKECDVYIDLTDNRIRAFEGMKERARKSVKSGWHRQQWRVDPRKVQ